jgi:hypothetical protein
MRRGPAAPDEWVDLSAYRLELVAVARGRAAMLQIRPAAGAAASAVDPFGGLEVRLTRLGFERAADGTWLRRSGRFVPRRFPVHLPLSRLCPRRVPLPG